MILVTGATGFLGRSLIPVLLKNNKNKIICLVRKNSNTDFLRKYKNVIIRYADITQKISLEKALKNVKTVIHLAALISSNDEKLLYKVNTEGAENLIEACRKNKVKRIIAVSSMAATRDYLDDYGKSKLEADRLFLNSGLNVTILRPTLIYGKNSNSLETVKSFIKKIPLIVPIIGNGNYKVQPVHVNDVVSSIVSSVNNDKSINKIYEILGQDKITFNDFIDEIMKKEGIKKFKIHIPVKICLIIVSIAKFLYQEFPVNKDFIKDIKNGIKGDIKKASADLNYNPVGFKEGLNDI